MPFPNSSRTASAASDRRAGIPAIHALHLAEVLERWEIPHAALFDPLDLDEDDLARPDARISLDLVDKLVARARALSHEPALGIYMGMKMRTSAHGYLGFAALTSSTVRQALALAVRFAPTRTSAISLRLHADGDVASLVIDEHADFGSARDVVLLALIVGIWQIGVALTGRQLEGSVDVALPEPSYFARIAPIARDVRFSQPVTQFLFSAATLDLPMTMADPVAQRWVIEQCERDLDALGTEAQLAHRVRALLPKQEGGFRSLEEVAAELALSERTLKRRLAEGGVAYSTLVDEQRRERALLLLRSTDTPIAQIADQLGYTDQANFNRAFRRWVGATPASYRKTTQRRT